MRLGKYKATAESGIAFILPYIVSRATTNGVLQIINELNIPSNIKLKLDTYHEILKLSVSYHPNIINLIDKLDTKPNQETLALACLGNLDLAKKLLSMEIQPDYKCMLNACKSLKVEIISLIHNYKQYVDKQCFFNMIDSYKKSNNYEDFINLVQTMIYCGLNLDTECICYAWSKNLIINDLNKLGYESWEGLNKYTKDNNLPEHPEYQKYLNKLG